VLVALVPAPARRNNPALYRTATTDDKGHFTLRGVAPGDYTAFAWGVCSPRCVSERGVSLEVSVEGKISERSIRKSNGGSARLDPRQLKIPFAAKRNCC
jgi:hypothetical protein